MLLFPVNILYFAFCILYFVLHQNTKLNLHKVLQVNHYSLYTLQSDSSWMLLKFILLNFRSYVGWCLNNFFCIDGEVQMREDDPGCSLKATTLPPVTADALNFYTIIESSCAPGRWYRISEMLYSDE